MDDALSERGKKPSIRSYLAEWAANPPVPSQDPIQISGNENDKLTVKSGTMLNDDLVQENEAQSFLETENYGGIDPHEDSSRFLRPGDLVTLSGSGFSDGQLAVYIRTVDTQQQFYTIRGKWRIANPWDIDFISDRFISPERFKHILPYFPLNPIGSNPLPQVGREGGVPRPLGAELINLMLKFENDAMGFYRDHFEVLDTMQDALGHEHEHIIMTLEEIAQALGIKSSLTESQRYAIHKIILRNMFSISPNRAGAFTESYTIRPRWQNHVVNQVVEWTRTYQAYQKAVALTETRKNFSGHPITRFVHKARAIIQQSRQLRQPSEVSALSPSKEANSNDGKASGRMFAGTFGRTDRMILTLLRLYVQSPTLMKQGAPRAAASMILRNIDMYTGASLTPSTAYVFLQEIGVFKPWEDLHLLNEKILLPGHGVCLNADRMVRETDSLCERDKSEFVDTMKDLRKDWGDLPVFCIDDVSAAEIDDGFSIEPVPNSGGAFWVHVHVANPSAFIPKEHSVGQRAADLKRSFYAPEGVYPMIPPSLTHSQFSLGPNKPTITISAKVNKDGEILETDIKNGVIHNVVYITPNTLRKKVFGIDYDSQPSMILKVGKELREKTRPELLDNILETHCEALRCIHRVMTARRDRRLEKGGLDSSNRYPATVSVDADPELLTPFSTRMTEAYHYVGDPAIQVRGCLVDFFEKIDSTTDNLVSHVMLFGGEVAGQWCQERGIPLVYSGTLYHPEYKRITRESLADPKSNGELSLNGLPRGMSSSRPTRHDFLGMDQYVKVTSPLRRFSDLLAHWQIEAALRYEKEHGVRFPGAEAETLLPFSENEINALIERSTWQNIQKDQAQNRARNFWACQLLYRAFYYGETQLPETWKCLVKGTALIGNNVTPDGERNFVGSLLPFDFPCILSQKNDETPIQAGDLVEVRLNSIGIYELKIGVNLIRLLQRPPLGQLAASGFLV